MLIASSCHAVMILICESSSHHVSWLVLALTHHMMGHVVSNSDVVLFDHCDSSLSTEMLLAHRLSMVLLRLNDVTSQHLRILDLNLRIIENIIIVVYVLYNFNWLISFLLFRFR